MSFESLATITASNTLIALLLAAAACVASRLWRNPHVAHALWLLVLVKLITPPLASVSLPSSWFADAGGTATEGVDRQSVPSQSAPSVVDRAGDVSSPVDVVSFDPAALPQTAVSPDTERYGQLAFPGTQSDLEPAPEFHDGEAMARDLSDEPPLESVASLVGGPPVETLEGAAEIPGSDPPADESVARRGLVERVRATVPSVIVWVWCGGAVVSLLMLVRRCLQFRWIVTASVEADPELRADAEHFAGVLGLRRCPELRTVAARVPPLVWSAGGRPVILLPADLVATLDRFQTQAVLIHEEAHIRRRDHLVRWIEATVQIVLWWNPLAWVASRQMRLAEEQCCDAWVVWALPQGRRSYGEALLQTVDFLDGRITVPALARSTFGQFPFKRRIEMIMKRETSRRMSPLAAGVLFGLACSILPLGARSGAAVPPPQKEGESEVANSQTAERTIADTRPEERPDPAVVSGFDPAIAVNSTAQETTTSGTPAAQQRLEERIARLEAVVEQLIVMQKQALEEKRLTTPSGSSRRRPARSTTTARTSPNESSSQGTRRAAVSPKGDVIAVLLGSGRTSTVDIFDAASGKLMARINVNTPTPARSVQISDDGKTLGVVADDKVSVFQIPTGRALPPVPVAQWPRATKSTRKTDPRLTTNPNSAATPTPGRAESRLRYEKSQLAKYLQEWEAQERLLEIELKRAELSVAAAKQRLSSLLALGKNTVAQSEITDAEFKLREAELDIEQARTRIDLHHAQKRHRETQADESSAQARRELEAYMKRFPASPEATRYGGLLKRPAGETEN